MVGDDGIELFFTSIEIVILKIEIRFYTFLRFVNSIEILTDE
jgi:hypothetical protein